MAVRLIIQLYDGKNFTGKSRFVVASVSDMKAIDFGDRASSAKIMLGTEYKTGDVVRVYQHPNFEGKYAEIGPGEYPDLSDSPVHLNNCISSLEMKRVHIPQSDPVYLIVNVFKDPDFKGRYRSYIYSEPSLSIQDFDDEITSLQVIKGPDYNGHVATLYQNPNYSGETVSPGQLTPGTSIANLKDKQYKFNDKISSVRIYHPDDISI